MNTKNLGRVHTILHTLQVGGSRLDTNLSQRLNNEKSLGSCEWLVSNRYVINWDPLFRFLAFLLQGSDHIIFSIRRKCKK